MTTKTYLVTKCKEDGSTPMGECPEVEVEALMLPWHNDYQSLLAAFYKLYPEWQIVSWGLKEEILAHRAAHNN
jgi:hypothetical protein